MRKINWGIIGLGNVAQKFLEGFQGVENSNLLAIASKNKSKILKFKKQFKIKEEFVFNKYEDILNCEDIDIIYISLPNSYHYEWISRSIEKNKKVLVEKPATINFEEAQKLSEMIKKKNIFFNEGFMYRYDSQIKKIIELIKNNEIGDLISMESSFGVNILTKKKFFFFEKEKKIDKNSRQFNNQLGGGCILDLGCYPTSLSLLICSLIKNINYKKFKITNLVREIGSTGVDINAEAKIIFDNSFNSKVKASFKKNLGNNTVIKGEKGNMFIKNTFIGIKEITIVLKDKTYEIKNLSNENIFSQEISSISKSILDDSNEVSYPGMQLEETILNMKILDYWKNEKL
ncbi:Gfo/Idh/MocA family oxidoreductase [Candidatus Pelagibacter sp.]|nr:Gfo/Idh/MocA family oxidoreductase [Candidatus Pelagibacter sp.]